MKEFSLFGSGFIKRLVTLSGFPALFQSEPVKKTWQSTPVVWWRKWYIVVLVLGWLTFLVVNKTEPFELARLEVSRHPNWYKSHLNLAKVAAEKHDYQLADKEFSLALKTLAGKSVLGITSEFDEVNKLVYPVEVIGSEIVAGEKFLQDNLDHRDVLLRLAVDYWQLLNLEEAQEYLDQAKLLDPNNLVVGEVADLVENKSE